MKKSTIVRVKKKKVYKAKKRKKNELLPTHKLIIIRPSLVNVASFSSPMTLVLRVGCACLYAYTNVLNVCIS